MTTRISISFGLFALLAVLLLIPQANAAEETEADVIVGRMRDALRNTMLQLRDAQNQVAILQTTQVASEQKIKELDAKVDSLNKQAVSDRNASANVIAELNTRMEEQRLVVVSFQAAIEKWKKSYKEVTTLAQKKESERAKFEAKSLKLERQVQDQQVRNIKMYKAGLEIINRYEKFGLGDAILAREPFVGSSRVKFQNLIQNDQDKLTDQRITTP
jgi:chromosome segregation ATPase